MRFFIFIHRSIFDNTFYKDVLGFKRRVPLLFFFQLIFFASFFQTISHTVKLFDRTDGLSMLIPRIFPGMSIELGEFNPGKLNPYLPNPVYIEKTVMLLDDQEFSEFRIPDSVIFIDTSRTTAPKDDSSIKVLLTKKTVYINFLPGVAFNIPYTSVVPQNEVFKFTGGNIQKFLKTHIFTIFLELFIRHFFMLFISMLSIVFFLSFSAHIFNARRGLRFKQFIKIALFVVTPVGLGVVFTSLAGTNSGWVWHLTVFGSTVIMFRSVRSVIIFDDKPLE